MQIHTATIVFTLLASFAWIIIAYCYYAKNRGWWTSDMFISDTSMIKIIAYLGLPGAAIGSAFLVAWWSAIIVIIFGLFLALFLTILFRSFVQYIAVLGMIVSWVIGIYMLFQA